jgi:hypothetical protein
MMRFLPLLLLSCCAAQDVKPTEAEMDRVEAALKPLPCIGNLADWERRYYYMPEYAVGELDAAIKQDREPKPIGYDKSVVEIDLREAHYEEFGSGRKSYVGFPPGSGDTDDRDYRVAWGGYDLKAGTLHMADCGPNMSPP